VVVGGMNTLVLSLQGGVLSFLVNGQVIRTVRDAHPLPPGSWGICVGSSAGATQGHYSHVALVGALAPASRPTLPTGPYQAISDTDFSVGNEQNWTFGLNTTANGEIGGGRYNLSVQNGWTQVEYPLNFAPLGDGQVATIVRPEGRGKVGIMGRWTKDAQGKWDLYAFWIDNLGYIGATRWLRDQTTTLFQLHTNLVRANQDNVLVLRITGATLLFYLNDRHVYTYHASTALPAGRWGMYISSDTGDGMTQAHYLRVLIAG
jgi:hypothetical protein